MSIHLTRTRPALSPPVPYPGTPEPSDLAVLDGRIPKDSPLTVQDVEDLKELYDDLNSICSRAKDRSVRIILDAEHRYSEPCLSDSSTHATNSWYQPAIDAFGHALMERFNKLPDHRSLASRFSSGLKNAQRAELQPIVYVTYQAYLRRSKFLLSVRLICAATHYLSTTERPLILHAHLHSPARTTMHSVLSS